MQHKEGRRMASFLVCMLRRRRRVVFMPPSPQPLRKDDVAGVVTPRDSVIAFIYPGRRCFLWYCAGIAVRQRSQSRRSAIHGDALHNARREFPPATISRGYNNVQATSVSI